MCAWWNNCHVWAIFFSYEMNFWTSFPRFLFNFWKMIPCDWCSQLMHHWYIFRTLCVSKRIRLKIWVRPWLNNTVTILRGVISIRHDVGGPENNRYAQKQTCSRAGKNSIIPIDPNGKNIFKWWKKVNFIKSVTYFLDLRRWVNLRKKHSRKKTTAGRQLSYFWGYTVHLLILLFYRPSQFLFSLMGMINETCQKDFHFIW